MSAPDSPDIESFADAVRAHAPDLRSEEHVLAATQAVLAELSSYVTGPAAQRLAPAVPEEVRAPLDDAAGPATGGASDEFFAGVAEREEGGDLGTAAHHVQAVLRAIADTADLDAVRAVREQLSADLRRIFDDERQRDAAHRLGPGARGRLRRL